MPAPPSVYHEHEAAILFGYTLQEWQEETTANKAKAIAHSIHRNLREGFTSEAAMEKGKKQSGSPGQDYTSLMRSMGIA